MVPRGRARRLRCGRSTCPTVARSPRTGRTAPSRPSRPTWVPRCSSRTARSSVSDLSPTLSPPDAPLAMTSHLLAFLLSAAATTTVLAQESTLQVSLAGIQHDRGSIRVGLYSDPKTFRKEAQAVAIQQVAAAPGNVTVNFTALPPGRYAIMAYH